MITPTSIHPFRLCGTFCHQPHVMAIPPQTPRPRKTARAQCKRVAAPLEQLAADDPEAFVLKTRLLMRQGSYMRTVVRGMPIRREVMLATLVGIGPGYWRPQLIVSLGSPKARRSSCPLSQKRSIWRLCVCPLISGADSRVIFKEALTSHVPLPALAIQSAACVCAMTIGIPLTVTHDGCVPSERGDSSSLALLKWGVLGSGGNGYCIVAKAAAKSGRPSSLPPAHPPAHLAF